MVTHHGWEGSHPAPAGWLQAAPPGVEGRPGPGEGIPWGPLGQTWTGSAPKAPAGLGPSEAGLPPQVGTRPWSHVVPSAVLRPGPLSTRLRVHSGNPPLCPPPPVHGSHPLLHPSHRGCLRPPTPKHTGSSGPGPGHAPPGRRGPSHRPRIAPNSGLPQRPPVCPRGPGRTWPVPRQCLRHRCRLLRKQAERGGGSEDAPLLPTLLRGGGE